MASVSPFAWISERAQPRLLATLTLLVVGLSLWLSSVGQALVTDAAPLGIVSYEFAGQLEAWGYSALWVPEAVGRDPFTFLAYIAAKTDRLIPVFIAEAS